MTDDDDPGDATTLDEPSAATGFRVSTTAAASPRSGRYQRGPEIARGGLGTVTSALDRTLQRQVAIKELHTRTEQGRQRFVREALTTARLQHPAIVPIFDVGTWEAGDPYLVLKLLEGKTLAEQLATMTSMASRLALLPNLLAVADALGYAHEQQVVHRDVKPANIMTGSHGETVLLDWG
ncbi:MAG TPA: serine/threonine-protein kinase, partial [Kofleriaceae bacterium]|nr:serine/threonine-protein kinase [Kofleriaceae bacterium]